jgi:hypothetical protein
MLPALVVGDIVRIAPCSPEFVLVAENAMFTVPVGVTVTEEA